MKELYVGEKVAVYTAKGRKVGVIQKINPLSIKVLIGSSSKLVHRSQCRRVFTRKLREFWVNVYEHSDPTRFDEMYPDKELADNASRYLKRKECIHVREVRERLRNEKS